MSEAVKVSDAPPKNERLKIFISYSRIDAAAADTLVETLEARGFEVTIDRRALPFGEKWQAELAEFIRLSDTVIWLISEASVRSEWVNWELDEVARRAKRLVPVMIGDTPRDRLPRQLGEIHILPAEGQFHHVRDIDTLLEVLETDRAWLKQASRLQDRAAEWLANGRPSARLLSRAALADAERWNDRRPPKSPAPAQEVLDLLLVSRQSASRWQRRIVGGSLALTIGALALAGFAYQQQHRAQRSEAVTLKITDESQHTESGLLSEAARAISDQPGGGDTSLAILLALEGMPDKLSDDASRIERPWVAETQLQLSRAFGNHRSQRYWTQSGGVEKLTWNYDGKLLASSAGKTATIFDVLTGKVVASVTHENWVHEVKWNSSGRYLATGYSSSRIVDAGTASVTARVPHGDSVGINALEWSPDGQFWATGSVDKTVRITEAATGKELANIAHDGAVNVVAWSPNGKYIASGAARTARIIAPDTGRELSRISHESTVLCAA